MADLFTRYHKTRLAPTPSGFLHLGNILSFSITAALARKTGANILLRIDDLDQLRVNEPYLQDIFDTLNFLEIPWDEGPRDVKEFKDHYSQLHRMAHYQKALDHLAENRHVFACICSRSQLQKNECVCHQKDIPLNTDNASWRLITSNGENLKIKDYRDGYISVVLSQDMNNFVVRKKDGMPAYQLTSVVDDLVYGVDMVVRGEDLWPSTIAQHVLASRLGENKFDEITFHHHPLLMETAGKKLSKSAGATSVRYLRENGKSAKAIYQLIANMLGIKEQVANWQQLGGLMIS